jgi:hypothetical protein
VEPPAAPLQGEQVPGRGTPHQSQGNIPLVVTDRDNGSGKNFLGSGQLRIRNEFEVKTTLKTDKIDTDHFLSVADICMFPEIFLKKKSLTALFEIIGLTAWKKSI